MSTHNLCFEQKYEKYQNFYLKTQFLVAKFSIYLNRRVYVMVHAWNDSECALCTCLKTSFFCLMQPNFII